MWLPRPLYEALPYLYGALALTFMAVSWFGSTGWASVLLLICGSTLLLVSVVLWLMRRDVRDLQREYDSRSLDRSLDE